MGSTDRVGGASHREAPGEHLPSMEGVPAMLDMAQEHSRQSQQAQRPQGVVHLACSRTRERARVAIGQVKSSER